MKDLFYISVSEQITKAFKYEEQIIDDGFIGKCKVHKIYFCNYILTFEFVKYKLDVNKIETIDELDLDIIRFD